MQQVFDTQKKLKINSDHLIVAGHPSPFLLYPRLNYYRNFYNTPSNITIAMFRKTPMGISRECPSITSSQN